MIGLREVLVLDMRIHRGSFFLGVGIGVAVGAAVGAIVSARQQRVREREAIRS